MKGVKKVENDSLKFWRKVKKILTDTVTAVEAKSATINPEDKDYCKSKNFMSRLAQDLLNLVRNVEKMEQKRQPQETETGGELPF